MLSRVNQGEHVTISTSLLHEPVQASSLHIPFPENSKLLDSDRSASVVKHLFSREGSCFLRHAHFSAHSSGLLNTWPPPADHCLSTNKAHSLTMPLWCLENPLEHQHAMQHRKDSSPRWKFLSKLHAMLTSMNVATISISFFLLIWSKPPLPQLFGLVPISCVKYKLCFYDFCKSTFYTLFL